MKRTKTIYFTILAMGFLSMEAYGQFQNPNNRFGRQRSNIPQAQEVPREPEKLTAAQMVDKQMPEIIQTLSLDSFEEAIVRSVLTNSVQKRMELQILQLEPQKMREEYEKINTQQDEELKASLPEEKYLAFQEMAKNPSKMKREAKKKRKKKKKEKKNS